jgi:hypothetical protein
LPLTIAGSGVLLVAGAVGFGLWGNSNYHAAQSEMMDQARRDSLYDSANTKRHFALGMGAAGIACGGVAALLHFTGWGAERSSPATKSARLHVVPLISGVSMGLVALGRF